MLSLRICVKVNTGCFEPIVCNRLSVDHHLCFGYTTIHNPCVSKICNITQVPKISLILQLLDPLQQALPPFMEHFTCRVKLQGEGFAGIRGAAR